MCDEDRLIYFFNSAFFSSVPVQNKENETIKPSEIILPYLEPFFLWYNKKSVQHGPVY